MKKIWVLSLVVPSLLTAVETKEGLSLDEYIQASQDLLDSQNDTQVMPKKKANRAQRTSVAPSKNSSNTQAGAKTRREKLAASSKFVADDARDDSMSNTEEEQPSGQASPASASAEPKQLSSGFNAPYALDLSRSWDIFVTGSFLYWKAVEEGMQTYTLYTLETDLTAPGQTTRTENYETGTIDFKYRPGFKVGLGVDIPYDNWQIYSEYTWYHHRFTDYFTFKGPNSNLSVFPAFQSNLFPDFNLKLNDFTNFLLIPSTLNSLFDLHLNWAVLELARSYYVGSKLAFRTHFGLRGDRNTQSIAQYFNLAMTTTGLTDNSSLLGHVEQKTDSWAVGPRAGVEADYLLGGGVKIFGDVAASLQYTKYSLKAYQTAFFSVPLDMQTQTSTIDNNTHSAPRPILETGIGLGWGRNFNNNSWHLDLDVSYDFIAMWNQNMFRELIIQNTVADSGDGDTARVVYHDLFLYGLTAKFALAF